MKRWSPVILILGFLLIAYPTLSDAYSQWQLQRALAETVVVDGFAPDEYFELQQVFARDAELKVEAIVPENVELTAPTAPAQKDPGPTLGLLKIESINLNVSIYNGTGDAQLQKGAGQISGTGNVGEMGSNTALAGHRRTFFRNLDKLQPGDEITIETEQGPLYYEIYKMHIVEPTDLSVLNRSQKHSLLTLITCHPLYTSQQRLIVHAYLK